MIITETFQGSGLGNQLHNYLAVRCLALDKGYEFGIKSPEKFKGHSFMNLDMGWHVLNGVTPVEGERPTELPYGIENYYKETTSDHDPAFFDLPDSTYIHGNLQGPKYFAHHKKEIKEWLKVEPLEMEEDVCVINLRGGEYVGVADFFLPAGYWQNAIAEMLKINPKMRFEIHTDDPTTARKFFPIHDGKFPMCVKNIGLNWRAIRYAHYLILSNSSFAIIPSFLNENAKKIIAPKYFCRFNRGFWHLRQNLYPWMTYMDDVGDMYSYKQCIKEMEDEK